MSIHSIRPETEVLLRKQRRNSFISSAIIGILVLVLLLLLLSLYMLAPLFKEVPTIVTYESSDIIEEEVLQKKEIKQIRPKPPSASSTVAKVIAANTLAPTAVPVPDVEVEITMDGFGSDGDFGDGWGSGSGGGTGGGGASFFQQKVKADRIAYVIDYSQSMGGPRVKLMRKELTKSIKGLPAGMSYQMIFFAGPSWVAGDEVSMAKGRKSATVKQKSATYDWVAGGVHDWKTKGKKNKPDWILSSTSHRRKSIKLVEETQLVWGTDWEPALEMAIAMDPPPQVIFFMTDGVTGGKADALARKLGAKANTKDIVINTVAMMEPRAEGAMKELAKRTNGQFTVIDKKGKARKVPLK